MSDNNSKKRSHEGEARKGKKRTKHWDASGLNVGSGQAIPHGCRGVLVTCESGWEERAAGEAISLFDEHYNKLAASSTSAAPAAAAAEAGQDKAASSAASKDISALIAEEVAELKDKAKQRFTKHNIGIKGCLFIVFPEEPASPTPLDVVLSVCKEAQETKTLRARHCHRLLPITHVVYAGMDAIRELAPQLVQDEFPSDEGAQRINFAVEYEHRASDKFERMDVINCFVNPVKQPPHKVNLGAPEKTIIVQLCRNVCAASVVTQYRELAKFNIRKLTDTEDEGGKAGDKKEA